MNIFEITSTHNNTNSEGRLIAHDKTHLDNFWNWFNGSKAVDEHGRPLVLYHGTVADFSIFDIEKSSHGSRFGPGHYFSNDKKTMAAYSGKENSHIMPVYIKMLNPMPEELTKNQINSFMNALQTTHFSNGYDATNDHKRIHTELLNNPQKARSILLSNSHFISKKDWQHGMTAAGFDGIIEMVFHQPEYVVIHPTQIKSAIGNNGNYSQDDDITKENY